MVSAACEEAVNRGTGDLPAAATPRRRGRMPRHLRWPVIRLRQQLGRGIRHSVLEQLLLLLLVLVLAMTAFHESHETIAGHPGEFCVAFVGILLGLQIAFVVAFDRVRSGDGGASLKTVRHS